MIQAPSKDNNSPRQGGRQSRRNSGNSNGFPNLTIADVDFNRKLTRVLAAQDPAPPNNYGNAIILKVAYDGKTFLWNLKPSNPCFETLYKAAKNGSDPNSYIGMEFYMFMESNEFNGKNFITIEMKNDSSSKKSGR